MRIVSFDLGSATGWAAWNGHVQSGVWKNPHRYSKSPGQFFASFRTWLLDMQRWHQPQLVAWEHAHPGRGQNAGLILYGLITRVQEWAYHHEVETMHIFPSTLKKVTTGDGRADKAAMVAAMRKRWQLPRLTDHNSADALAVLAWAIERSQ